MTDQTPKKEQAKPARGQKKDDKKLPDYYARVVVVPIANPETAPELLELAKAVVERDGGGRIIALAITLSDSDAESNRERLDELEALVEKHKPQPKPEAEPAADAEDEPAADADEDQEDEGEDAEQEKNTTPPPPDRDKDLPYTLEFVTRTANAIARGILDQARENGAELILVGVQQPKRGEVALGTVVQAVLSAAPCDVLVYRYSESPYFDRIVVPVDGTPPSRMAVRMGIIVANAHKHCPVEAIHVLPGGTPEFEGRARIAQTLEGVPGRGIVKQTVVRGYDAGSALLSRTDEDQLIIMGFAQHNDFEKWLYDRGKSTREVLNKAPGPVMIAVRNMETVTQQQRVLRRAISWLRPRLTDIEQEQVVWDANSNAGVNLDYVVLMLVSATLASLGLLLNSGAVIIGAMLVAPLMAPLNALGVGLATARLDLAQRSMITVLAGVAIASGVGVLTGLLVPLETPTPEMMSRVSPTLLDAFVALASGVVGSYATARKDIPAALAGVAIAAALVPPICTFGLQLAFGNYQWAFGALLLFITNMISIIVIATLMFRYLGMQSLRRDMRYVSLVIFALLLLPAVMMVLFTTQRASQGRIMEQEIRRLLSPVQIVGSEVSQLRPLTATVTVRSPNEVSPEAVGIIEEDIESIIGQDIRLQLIVERVVLPPGDVERWTTENTDRVGDVDRLLQVEDGVIVPVSGTEEALPDAGAESATEEAPTGTEEAP